MPTWALINWRWVVAIALAVGLFATGWTAQGWRLTARAEALEAAHSLALVAAEERARKTEQTWRAVADSIDRTRTAELRKSQDENEALRAAVDAGRKRLRVAARCPAVVPGTADAARVGDGAGAELDPGARSDYFALRSGIVRAEAQLAACQDLLRGLAASP